MGRLLQQRPQYLLYRRRPDPPPTRKNILQQMKRNVAKKKRHHQSLVRRAQLNSTHAHLLQVRVRGVCCRCNVTDNDYGVRYGRRFDVCGWVPHIYVCMSADLAV